MSVDDSHENNICKQEVEEEVGGNSRNLTQHPSSRLASAGKMRVEFEAAEV